MNVLKKNNDVLPLDVGSTEVKGHVSCIQNTFCNVMSVNTFAAKGDYGRNLKSKLIAVYF